MNTATSPDIRATLGSEERIYLFPEGIPGFPHCRRFALIHEHLGPLMRLQSVDHPRVAFVVAEAHRVLPGYRIIATHNDLSGIGLTDPDASLVLVILTVTPNPALTTANLRGPLVLNQENGLARQLVLADDFWPLRYRVFGD